MSLESSVDEKVAHHFHLDAQRFDAIYDDRKGPIARFVDNVWRGVVRRRLDLTVEKLAPLAGKSVLDVGCGSGRFCFAYAQHGAAHVLGVDFAEAMIDIARKYADELHVADRCQFRVGRFYYLRESYPAAIARLKTLTDTYPLYSQADEALLMLGRSYESEATLIKNSKLLEAPKMRLVKEYQTEAANTYDRIIEHYPLSDRAEDARSHLKDLGRPIPTPTPEAIASYKAEEASRSEIGKVGKIMSTFHKSPDDLARASKIGEPTLVDPQQTSAPQIIRSATSAAMGVGDTGSSNVSVEKVTPDTKANDPIPRSDAGSAAPAAASPSPHRSPHDPCGNPDC